MTGHRYHINLFWSAEDQCWVADVPDLQYCSAHGEALGEVETAIGAWVEAQSEAGRPIPEPCYRPANHPARSAA